MSGSFTLRTSDGSVVDWGDHSAVWLLTYETTPIFPHLSVYVYGREISFCKYNGVKVDDGPYDRTTNSTMLAYTGLGSFRNPRQAQDRGYDKRVLIGQTSESLQSVENYVEFLKENEFKKENYSLIFKNCRHFANELIYFLIGKYILLKNYNQNQDENNDLL